MKNTWRRFANYFIALWVPHRRVGLSDSTAARARAIDRALLEALPETGCSRCGSTPVFLGHCGSSLFWFRCAQCFLVWAYNDDRSLVSSSYLPPTMPVEDDPELLMFDLELRCLSATPPA